MVDITPTFTRSLLTDILVAREHLAEHDEQPRRRNLVRASFAAIEGLVWLLRCHVLDVGNNMGEIGPTEMLALQDRGYAVGDRGKLRETAQFLPLKTAIRLAVRLAQRIDSDLAIDFDDSGWSSLDRAIDVRHRITHPKSETDLVVSDSDLIIVNEGFAWLLAVTKKAMHATNHAARAFLDDSRALLTALEAKDPEALAMYNALLHRDEDD
ncbi:MAG: hypothetical protein ACOY45_10635 [Pseudomonadota bacterium]